MPRGNRLPIIAIIVVVAQIYGLLFVSLFPGCRMPGAFAKTEGIP